jgi:ABC-type phosphate transport system permease subunit
LEKGSEEVMSIILALLLGLLIGFILGVYYHLRHSTEIFLKAFEGMSEEDVIQWYRKKFNK